MRTLDLAAKIRICGYLWHATSMASRDGDGWIECTCGSKHWGKFGAAGLLL